MFNFKKRTQTINQPIPVSEPTSEEQVLPATDREYTTEEAMQNHKREMVSFLLENKDQDLAKIFREMILNSEVKFYTQEIFRLYYKEGIKDFKQIQSNLHSNHTIIDLSLIKKLYWDTLDMIIKNCKGKLNLEEKCELVKSQPSKTK